MDVTTKMVGTRFTSSDLRRDFKAFVQQRMHCVASTAGSRFRRSPATTLQRQKANQVVQVDVLYMGPSKRTKLKYVLIITDDLTSCSWFMSYNSPDRDVSVTSLGRRIAAFGGIDYVGLDCGPHFTVILMQ